VHIKYNVKKCRVLLTCMFNLFRKASMELHDILFFAARFISVY
jgi:hypothetical protein